MHLQSFSDQLGEMVYLPEPPQRIISLVPSQTELLHDLGLDKKVAGITKFCVHPPHWRRQKRIIGGTKNFHFDEIDSLKPDLIIGNKEENYKEGIDRLKEKYPVWMSNIISFGDALEMIRGVGKITGKEKTAEELAQKIIFEFEHIKIHPPKRVLYLIWRNPWMAAGAGTFIHAILTRLGFTNSVSHRHRYPELSSAEINYLNPDMIFLSSEPYPFRQKHQNELMAIVPSKTILVDGEMFSWYGSRLLKSPAYFNSLAI